MRPLRMVVTVGSDHHPFDRLVGWVDRWMDEQHESVDLVVQHGTAGPPRHGRSIEFLQHKELMRLIADADVVVLQGGPMGIVEARRLGHKPLAVPRMRSLGEVVDDHQMPFCRSWPAWGRSSWQPGSPRSAQLSTSCCASRGQHGRVSRRRPSTLMPRSACSAT